MKQPDIEIYLKDADLTTIMAWLTHSLGECSEWQQKGKVFKCQAIPNNISITWYPKAVGGWNCLHFASNQTPWINDLACAQSAHDFLKIEIRCAPNGWSEQVAESETQANQWLKIKDNEVIDFFWKT